MEKFDIDQNKLSTPVQSGTIIGEINATLANELGLNQPTTSRHLKVLRERGLVTTVRTGTIITYHLSDSRLIQALDIMRSIMRDRLAYQVNLMEEVHETN